MSWIKSWNYSPPQFNFFNVKDEEELYLGVELEVDNGGRSEHHAKKVVKTIGEDRVYCMGDGSLSDGFEMATHPCTYEYHKTIDYEKVFNYLSENGYKSHNTRTCGMHVHLNRSFFGKEKIKQELCLSKLLFLLEKYWDYATLIARRSDCGYARRKYYNENESALDIYAKYKSTDGYDSSKYNAINVLHNKTFEIRIFKGTLNYKTFMATLEFCKKFAIIAKKTDILSIQDVTWDDIKSTFSQELIDYIELREQKKREKEEREREQARKREEEFRRRQEERSRDYRFDGRVASVELNSDTYYFADTPGDSGWIVVDSDLPSGYNITTEATTIHTDNVDTYGRQIPRTNMTEDEYRELIGRVEALGARYDINPFSSDVLSVNRESESPPESEDGGTEDSQAEPSEEVPVPQGVTMGDSLRRMSQRWQSVVQREVVEGE